MPVWQGACSTIPGRAIEAAAIPQVHDIHQRAISGSFPGARTNCCGCRFMRKRLDAYRVDHPVVRGQRHDQATFGAQLRFADSPGKGHRVSYHPSLRAASVAIAGRQNAASLPAHLVLHAIELNGCAAGRGCFRPYRVGGSQLRLSGVAVIDRPAAHVTHQRLSSILLAAANRAYVGTAASRSVCSGLADRGARAATSCQMGQRPWSMHAI